MRLRISILSVCLGAFLAVAEPALAEIDVTARVDGAPTDEIAALIEQSLALTRDDEAVADAIALERLVAVDRDSIRSILRSRAYYGGTVRAETVVDDGAARIVFSIDPGPPYLLEDVVFDYVGVDDPRLPRDIERFGLHAGMVAKAEPLKELSGRLVAALRDLGYPDPQIESQRFVSD